MPMSGEFVVLPIQSLRSGRTRLSPAGSKKREIVTRGSRLLQADSLIAKGEHKLRLIAIFLRQTIAPTGSGIPQGIRSLPGFI